MSTSSSSTLGKRQAETSTEQLEQSTLTPEVEAKVLRQIEFYFSDSNLPRDNFLMTEISKDAGGWVALQTIASFKRVESLTKSVDAVAHVCRQSESLLEVSEDGSQIRRIPAILDAETAKAQQDLRTLHVSNLPFKATLDEIFDFLGQHAKVMSVRMLRNKSKQNEFNGSAFVETATEDDAAKLAGVTSAEWDGKVAKAVRKADWIAKKEARKNKQKAQKETSKESADSEESTKKAEVEPKLPIESLDSYAADRIIKISGFTGEEASREDIKEVFNSESSPVAWVDFSRGDSVATIRLKKESETGAAALITKLTADSTKIADQAVAFAVPSEAEETKYWEDYRDQLADKQNKTKRGGNRGGRGGRGGGRGRGRGGGRKRQRRD